MNIEAFRDYCLSKHATTEELPFDEDTLVFKVAGKMFALCSISDYKNGITLKSDPDEAISLREMYEQVKPGFHMHKSHWNTILPEAGLLDDLLYSLIDTSYTLVITKLSKSQKLAFKLN